MNRSVNIVLPDGGVLHARVDAGPETAPWLVLSNSVLTDLSIWDGQIAALTKRFSVLRYDQRGHGKSSVSAGPAAVDTYGMDLLSLLESAGIARCVFAGLSMGVPSGLAAFQRAPDRFQAFVAVDGIAKSGPGREAFWAEKREAARAQGMEALALETARRWLPGEEADSGAVSRLVKIVTATPVEGFAAATNALGSYDYSPVADQIDCPFLAIAGAEDGNMPEAMRLQFGGIANARFETIEAAGHLPNFQRPEAFNATLLAFLESVI